MNIRGMGLNLISMVKLSLIRYLNLEFEVELFNLI